MHKVNLKILLVEDDEPLRRVLGKQLRLAAYEVTETESISEGLRLLHETRFDLLLTDLRLPDGDGMELVWSVQQDFPEVRTMVMSGNASGKEQQTAASLGVVSVLHKPFSGDDLARQVALAADCRGSFFGNLHGLSLIDILQMYHLAKKSVTLHVGGVSGGRIDICNGELVDIECRGLRGEPALRALLVMKSGCFQTAPLRPNWELKIHVGFETVVLDALRAIDEARQAVH